MLREGRFTSSRAQLPAGNRAYFTPPMVMPLIMRSDRKM